MKNGRNKQKHICVGRGILDTFTSEDGARFTTLWNTWLYKRILLHGLRNTFVKLLSVSTSTVKMSSANVHTFTEVGRRLYHGDILYSGFKDVYKIKNYIQTLISAQVLLWINLRHTHNKVRGTRKRGKRKEAAHMRLCRESSTFKTFIWSIYRQYSQLNKTEKNWFLLWYNWRNSMAVLHFDNDYRNTVISRGWLYTN